MTKKIVNGASSIRWTPRVGLALVLALSSIGASAEKIDDKVQMVRERDKIMNAAIAEARRTLDDFLALSKKPPAGATHFKLKVQLSDENGVEHMWFVPFKEIEGGYAGVLANEPYVVKSVTLGKVYAFKREQISDWGYQQDGKQIGSFTVCALFKTMPADDVARYKKDHGFVC